MIYLLGYWGSVTIVLWVVLAVPLILFFSLVNCVVEWASRDRVNIKYKLEKLCDKYYFGVDEVGVILLVSSLVFWAVYAISYLGYAMANNRDVYSLVYVADFIASMCAGFMGYITLFAIITGLFALVTRKGFDFYFSVKSRLDKLQCNVHKV